MMSLEADKSSKQSLAIAYAQKRKAAPKKMFEGGEVKKDKPLYDASGYEVEKQPVNAPAYTQPTRLSPHPKKMNGGGLVGNPKSIVAAMKAKQLPSNPVSEAEPDFLSNEGEDLDYGLDDMPEMEEDEGKLRHQRISSILMRIGQK